MLLEPGYTQNVTATFAPRVDVKTTQALEYYLGRYYGRNSLYGMGSYTITVASPLLHRLPPIQGVPLSTTTYVSLP